MLEVCTVQIFNYHYYCYYLRLGFMSGTGLNSKYNIPDMVSNTVTSRSPLPPHTHFGHPGKVVWPGAKKSAPVNPTVFVQACVKHCPGLCPGLGQNKTKSSLQFTWPKNRHLAQCHSYLWQFLSAWNNNNNRGHFWCPISDKLMVLTKSSED